MSFSYIVLAWLYFPKNLIILFLIGYIIEPATEKPAVRFYKINEHIAKLVARYDGMNLGNSVNLH